MSNPEHYQPTPDDYKAAEATITGDQSELSQTREKLWDRVEPAVRKLEENGEAELAKDQGFVSYKLGQKLFGGSMQELAGQPRYSDAEGDAESLFESLYLGQSLQEAVMASRLGYQAYIHNARNEGTLFERTRKMTDEELGKALEKDSDNPIKQELHEIQRTGVDNLLRAIEFEYRYQTNDDRTKGLPADRVQEIKQRAIQAKELALAKANEIIEEKEKMAQK